MINLRSPRGYLVSLLLSFTASYVSHPARAATACVWRVTNAPAPFYLVGTIHALSGKDYPLPKAYAEALENSRQFFFEIEPDTTGNFSKLFAAAAAYPKGDDIRRHIHPETCPVHRTGQTACILRVRVAHIHDFVLQFAGELGTLKGKRVEKSLQLPIIYAISRLLISFLTIS